MDAIWCNDLDTLAPAVWHGRLPVVYDSHEYFTEAEGLTGKPMKRAAWLMLERWAFKSLPCMITVNESIAESYRRTYGLEVLVVRNMPSCRRQDRLYSIRLSLPRCYWLQAYCRHITYQNI